MAVKILGCILLALLLTYVIFSVVGLVLKIVSRKKMLRKQMLDETDTDENVGRNDNTSTDVTSSDEGK